MQRQLQQLGFLSGVVAFAGSRHGTPHPVRRVVGAVLAAGGSVRVGCARGVDAAVRVACPSAVVVVAASRSPRDLVARTASVVAGASALVVFPAPDGSWGAGTLAAVRFAAGRGLVVWAAGRRAPGRSWAAHDIAGVHGSCFDFGSDALFCVVDKE